MIEETVILTKTALDASLTRARTETYDEKSSFFIRYSWSAGARFMRIAKGEQPTAVLMRIAYLDCFSGISGNMFLGALVAAGVPSKLLEDTVAALELGARIEISRVTRGGIAATKVDVYAHGEKDLPREVYWEQQKSAEVVHSHEHADSLGHAHWHLHAPDTHTTHAHEHEHEHTHSRGRERFARLLKKPRSAVQPRPRRSESSKRSAQPRLRFTIPRSSRCISMRSGRSTRWWTSSARRWVPRH